jgi:asparagine synthase (glutamine-hydrolysing)
MCGISGMVRWRDRAPSKAQGEKLAKTLHHRGPDESGIWLDGRALLVHNRLSIIDLSTGQQPLVSDDGRYVLVYNGEIYNFKEIRANLKAKGLNFRTNSDTEVVLKSFIAEGPRCLDRFRGMFAFAVWDKQEQSLFLARDRSGIKPLYYFQGHDFFAFSSELQGLLSIEEIPRRIDVQALDLYLHYQYVPAPLTILEGVKKLSPAHLLNVSVNKPDAAPVRYWDVRFKANHSRTEKEWLEQLDSVISDSVRLHLESDVPFGAFLSGGIDSSVVSYHMSRILKEPVKTFTIGFENPDFDESQFARNVASFLKSEHHEKIVSPDLERFGELLNRLVHHYGEPFADSSAIPTYFVSQLARRHVKMVLSGDGGDELFAGYNTYTNILGQTRSQTHKPTGLRALLQKFSAARLPADELIRNAKSPAYPEARRLHSQVYAYFRDQERTALYRPDVSKHIAATETDSMFDQIFMSHSGEECLSALQHLDFKTYLPGDILKKVDIASMMNSLEVRVPLLDHKVVEFASAVPAELKLYPDSNGEIEKKYLFKKYASGLFPNGTFDRPKRGFGVPIPHWFSGPLYGYVRDRILNPPKLFSELFNPDYLASLVSDPARAGSESARIWAVLFLSEWLEAFQVTDLSPGNTEHVYESLNL